MCKKKIDCWQPSDLSKSAGNCQRRAKIFSLRSVKRLMRISKHSLYILRRIAINCFIDKTNLLKFYYFIKR